MRGTAKAQIVGKICSEVDFSGDTHYGYCRFKVSINLFDGIYCAVDLCEYREEFETEINSLAPGQAVVVMGTLRLWDATSPKEIYLSVEYLQIVEE